ncbi:AtpZ/AtpI family protein [Algoriphagus sp. CAU 1675]|uniref:AtpZ/AtpI family protein n=1 Tax=Algoriphagus sp. CAU 1675 TaxID=3032597 RepID=UPI0023DB0034|nr:AtpZ/AtpI family protein [Algoriphagus sp. CAU 1675]MDF2158873.1 AtpZ/AtpI family protein [Algoriphagus sp. CAU 1675]
MSEKIPERKQQKSGPPAFVKYLGLSFQLFAVIGAGTFLGWWIQQKSEMKFPLWLLLFCFLSIVLAFYQLWKSMQEDE